MKIEEFKTAVIKEVGDNTSISWRYTNGSPISYVAFIRCLTTHRRRTLTVQDLKDLGIL